MSIRVGLLGTNTSHAGVYAGIINGRGPEAPRVEGAAVTAVYSSGRPGLSGSHPDAGELAARHGIERVMSRPDELVGDLDVVLVLDDFEGGALHGELASPYLAAGVPTFIDKPMTLDVTEASDLFDLAAQNGAPLLSCSALRFATELQALTDPAANLGTVSSVVSVGPGDWYNYGIHAVEAALAVAGPGATWVHRLASEQRDVTVIGHASGPRIVVETLRDAAYLFHLAAYGTGGLVQARIEDFAGFYTATMAAVLEMVRTGQSSLPRGDTLEVLAILKAGVLSANTGAAVALDDVLSAGAR